MDPSPLDARVVKRLRIVKNPPIEYRNRCNFAIRLPFFREPVCIDVGLDTPAGLLVDQGKTVVFGNDQKVEVGVAGEQGLTGGDHAGQIVVHCRACRDIMQRYGNAVGFGFKVLQKILFLLRNG